MPVRSINLKLVVPRDADGAGVRQALWTTHSEVNAAVAHYERHLLLTRTQAYETIENGEVTSIRGSKVETGALALARAAQSANPLRLGEPNQILGNGQEVLSSLRALYALSPASFLRMPVRRSVQLHQNRNC